MYNFRLGAAGALRIPLKRRGGFKMLKWVRFCGAKFRPQNETCSNVKIEKIGEVGKGENGAVDRVDMLDRKCRRQR